MVEETWISFVDKIKRYYSFSIEENKNLIIVSLFLGFIYSYRNWWDNGQVNLNAGVISLFVFTIVGLVTLYIHIAAQRLHALRLGYKPEFRSSPYTILGSILLCLLTNGVVAAPIYGGTEIHHILKHRLGHYRIGVNTVGMGLIALTGPIATLLFAYFLKIINIFFQSAFLDRVILINLLFAVWTVLPIPPLSDGIRLFFFSRLAFVYSASMVIMAALLIWITNNIFFILVGSAAIAFIAWFLYYISFEESQGFWA